MIKKRIGRVDFSSLKNPPEKHERATAIFFARRGEDIQFIRPHSIKGSRNPDYIMNGKIWEIKSPPIKTLVIITKDGRILTLKGKFDIL